MLVKFVNDKINDAQIGNLPPVVNSGGKPFELDDVAASAYVAAGILESVAVKAGKNADKSAEKTAEEAK